MSIGGGMPALLLYGDLWGLASVCGFEKGREMGVTGAERGGADRLEERLSSGNLTIGHREPKAGRSIS